MSIRLVLADDHPLILQGLESLFQMEEDLEVLACCANGEEALQAVRRHRPDVAVLDVRMPGRNGLDVARQIKAEGLGARVVLLTAALNDNEILRAFRDGQEAIVLKESAPRLLLKCIRKVHAGGEWVERQTARQAIEKMLHRDSGAVELAATLTPREIEIVRQVAGGKRNRDIGERLHISEGTVKIHLHNIYEKLGLDGRVALVRFAQEKGLL